MLLELNPALRFCRRMWDQQRDIFAHFINLLVTSPDWNRVQGLERIISMLSKYAEQISISDSVPLLPSTLPLTELVPYLTKSLMVTTKHKHQVAIIIGLVKSESIQTRCQLSALRSQRVSIEEERVCPVCYKRIGRRYDWVLLSV